jgi:hypothetical protein
MTSEMRSKEIILKQNAVCMHIYDDLFEETAFHGINKKKKLAQEALVYNRSALNHIVTE